MYSHFYAWAAWFFAAMFYAYQYVLRVLPNIGMPSIINHFHVGATEMGQFSGVYYIGYTLMHIPVGLLIDRFSVKKVLPVCIALTSLGLVPLIYSDLFLNAVLGRLIIGIASSASVLGLFKVIKLGFGEKKFTSMLGLSVTIGLFGAIYGGRPVDMLIETYGWEAVINSFIVFGLVFASLVFIFIPSAKQTEVRHDLSISSIINDLKILFFNGRLFWLSIIGGLMLGPLEGFADAWGTLFFESAYGLDRTTSSVLPSMIFFGMCFGSTAVGYITDKTGAHFKVIGFCGLSMLIAMVAIFSGLCNVVLLYILTFLVGVFSAYQMTILSKVRDYTPSRLSELTSAAANMIMMIFGTVFHNTIGFSIDYFKGLDISQSEAAIKSLSIIPIAIAVAIGILIIWSLKDRESASVKL